MRSNLVLVLVLVLGSGCAKPSELANRTCFPTASWSGPAYSCITGVPAVARTEAPPEEKETTAESEGGGEIEMGGDPAPEEKEPKKSKKQKEREEREEREKEKAAQKEREKEEREEKEKEKAAAKEREKEEKEKEKEAEKEKEKEKEKVADGDDGEGDGDADSGKGGGKLVSREDDEIRLAKKIIFKKDSEELSTKSKPLLDELVGFLADHDEIKKVEIAGYTDNKGDKEELKKLSADRAKAVKDYLVEHGIKSKRLTAKGYGSADPIASNKTKAGRNKNRRIEFHILKK